MPLNRPILDDRSYEQLRNELLQRIPVYAPEWTDHNVSDPGITLLELFSYLGENLLYRFNQIPETTYLEYLRLLQIQLNPAQPSRAMLSISTEKLDGVKVAIGKEALAGDIKFETENEVRVLPVSCLAISKASEELPGDSNTSQETDESIFYEQAYKSAGVNSVEDTIAYQSEIVSEDGSGPPVDFDEAVDGIMWLAVLVKDSDSVITVKEQLASHKDAPLLLNIGFIPEIKLDEKDLIPSAGFADRFRCPGLQDPETASAVEWQISTSQLDSEGKPIYRSVRVEGDTTNGLQGEGITRLRLPIDINECGPFELDIPDLEGTDDLPPPVDEEIAERIIFWLRVFRHDNSRFGKVIYVGTNSVTLIQTLKANAEFLGTGTGQPNQSYTLVNKNTISGSIVLEVEEADGWRGWSEVNGFFASQESDRHYVLDSEAGQIHFGNGLQAYVPQIGQRIRIKEYRYGGGLSGNVAPTAINKLKNINDVEVMNPLAAFGGADPESIENALDRIPGELRRRDRAVTIDDFKELALQTPAANLGRSECLPHFHPEHPHDTKAAGVVSVIIWPKTDPVHPDAPLPNKKQLQQVCSWLDARRLVTTELYVLPPSYHRIAIAVGIKVKPGFGIDAVRYWVELVIRQYLAPLPPYGPAGDGWPLGRNVYGPELEAAALQVDGVEYVEELRVVGLSGDEVIEENLIELAMDEVPELTSITVEDGPPTLVPGEIIEPQQDPEKTLVPIPVIKEVC